MSFLDELKKAARPKEEYQKECDRNRIEYQNRILAKNENNMREAELRFNEVIDKIIAAIKDDLLYLADCGDYTIEQGKKCERVILSFQGMKIGNNSDSVRIYAQPAVLKKGGFFNKKKYTNYDTDPVHGICPCYNAEKVNRPSNYDEEKMEKEFSVDQLVEYLICKNCSFTSPDSKIGLRIQKEFPASKITLLEGCGFWRYDYLIEVFF